MLYRTHRLVMAAVLAGSVAGIIYGLLNLAFISPLLHLAESYEHAHSQSHGQGGAAGAGEVIRAGLTLGLSLSVYIAYGFILAAVMHLAHYRHHHTRQDTSANKPPALIGIVWGLGGFTATHLAPAFVLSLSLPGLAHTHALALIDQQLWWWGIASMTAGGLLLVAIPRRVSLRVIGIVVAVAAIVVPALILGNGQVEDATGDVPAQLGALFVGRSLGAHALGWVVLGYGVAAALFHSHKH